MVTTEIKQEEFAFNTTELAQGLVDMPNDPPEIRKRKADGYHTRGISPDAIRDINLHIELQRLRKDPLLSTKGFERLLYLSATESPIIESLGLNDEIVRWALWKGAEAKITANRVRIVTHVLLKGFKLEEMWFNRIQKEMKTLSQFQNNLLQRVSPPPPDIRNR